MSSKQTKRSTTRPHKRGGVAPKKLPRYERDEDERTMRSTDVLHSISQSPVTLAVQSLMNNRVLSTSDSKSEASTTFDLGVVRAVKALMGQTTYKFACNLQTSLTAGTLTIARNIATSLTIYNEGSALIALFDECKLKSMRVQALLTAPSGFSQIVILGAIEWVVTTVTPTAPVIARLPHSMELTTFDPRPVLLVARAPVIRPFGETVDEGVAAPRIATGFNSTLRFCEAVGTNAVTTAATYYILKIQAVGEFRSRA